MKDHLFEERFSIRKIQCGRFVRIDWVSIFTGVSCRWCNGDIHTTDAAPYGWSQKPATEAVLRLVLQVQKLARRHRSSSCFWDWLRKLLQNKWRYQCGAIGAQKLSSWDDLLKKWEPEKTSEWQKYRQSKRPTCGVVFQGKQINEQITLKQSSTVKYEKAKDHANCRREEFKTYAFDYWQYLDSMVFWGDWFHQQMWSCAHRNGVPILNYFFL